MIPLLAYEYIGFIEIIETKYLLSPSFRHITKIMSRKSEHISQNPLSVNKCLTRIVSGCLTLVPLLEREM